MTDITGLLYEAKHGDTGAEARLFELLYADLHQLAHQRLRRSKPNTLLDTTALVHEAYLKINRVGYIQIADRSHFLAYAARVMRSVVVDLVRKQSLKRDGRDANDVADPSSLTSAEDEILRVDRALKELAVTNGRLARVVEMRYFAGMKEVEIAEALSLAERTVRRDWEKARMMLAVALK
jgi:RNA polymerase sigma factor (TIGR02999 family)